MAQVLIKWQRAPSPFESFRRWQANQVFVAFNSMLQNFQSARPTRRRAPPVAPRSNSSAAVVAAPQRQSYGDGTMAALV